MRKRRKIKLLLILILSAAAITFYCLFRLSRVSDSSKANKLPTSLADGQLRFPYQRQMGISRAKCQIPLLDPFDPSVSAFLKFIPQRVLECEGPPPLVSARGISQLYISHEIDALKHYGETDCFYSPITRETDDINYSVGHRQRFATDVEVQSEFMMIECHDNKSNVVFTDFFPFIVQKADVERRVKAILKETKAATKERLNVILLGLDSVSRSQFLRQMKQTTKFIREKLQSVELLYYNKVGTNTFPNLLAFLCNMTLDEISIDLKDSPLDNLPFIWKDFMNEGYRTMYAEDDPSLSAFNFPKKGFRQQPTDYYWRSFGLAIEKSSLFARSGRGCINRRAETEVILKWAMDLMDTFSQEPLFVLTYHNRLNHGSLEELAYQDKPVKNFLEKLHSKKHLDRTIAIIFSDHGLRFDDFRNTYVGRLEDKLPFACFILPGWFASRYPELYKNLLINQHRLTTPFDMYATLKDILRFTGQSQTLNDHRRTISLISSEVPANRSCTDASIDSKFCACVQRQRTNVTDCRVQAAAQEIVKKINSMTAEKRDLCSSLHLHTVLDAKVQFVSGENDENDMYDFLITLAVKPSNGIFDGIVWYSTRKNAYTVNKNIERINRYGNQSACLDDPILKPYCFCVTKTTS